jgi:hypothetical protein
MAPLEREEPPVCDINRIDSLRPGESCKLPSDPVALLALPVTRQSITCTRETFLPVVLIQRASNDTPTGLSIRSLAAGLTDARSTVDWRSPFCTSTNW